MPTKLKEDLTGMSFNEWTVISPTKCPENIKRKRTYWMCRCSCGKEKAVSEWSLKSGKTNSCGCTMRQDIIGKRFGYLKVLSMKERRKERGKSFVYWNCLCDCGKVVVVRGSALRNGDTKSCGCSTAKLIKEKLSQPEGEASFTKLFNQYKRMAKTRMHEFLLSREQFRVLTKQRCYYCGAEPAQIVDPKNYNGVYIYNGIDRVDSSRGYSEDNVVACCGRCNKAKSNYPIDNFINWVRKIYDNTKDIF